MHRKFLPTALAVGMVLLLPVWAAPLPAPPSHTVTTRAERAGRDYQKALRALHEGRAAEAVRSFESALRRDDQCAMAACGLSRALQRLGKTSDAREAAQRAETLAAEADDREQQLIRAWARHERAQSADDAERRKVGDEIRRDLDRLIAVYPNDPEIWILRGELSETALRGGPFFRAAFQLQPAHPLSATWKPDIPPSPEVKPVGTRPVGPLAPAAKLFDGLGQLTHPITTSNAEAQKFYEQGLRCFHSYVNPGGVRNSAMQSFQQAALLDPECAMAYWGLSFGPTNAMRPLDAANRAVELVLRKGTDKERRFCMARLLEVQAQQVRDDAGRKRGEAGRPGADRDRLNQEATALDAEARTKREAFLDALDAAILAYPDDVELWTWRGKVFSSYGQGPMAGPGMPYQLAAFRLQPVHPSPNHELVHSYEGIERPALGWPYSVNYRLSAPNMPHANHMQAHLSMRLGRWGDSLDATRTSRKMGLAGFPELDPSHHIDTMVKALAHEGRFAEADAEPRAYRDGLPWARLLQMRADHAALAEWAERRRARNTPDGFYMSAIVALDRNAPEEALPAIRNVEQQFRANAANLYRYNEVQGRYLVQTGRVDDGLKLLREAAAKAVKDTGLHAWGGGSYVLEVWGEAALRAARWDEAEEAYHEALAHEHGSVLGALGMQVVWERRGSPELAQHYERRARDIWKQADAGALERQLERLRKLASGSSGLATTRGN